MNVNKLMIKIIKDLQINAIVLNGPFSYRVKETHQIIRKHLEKLIDE